MQRPVVRLENNLVVLTRIDPSNRSTSMIMRIRPGWEELRQYLAGEADGKQRCVQCAGYCIAGIASTVYISAAKCTFVRYAPSPESGCMLPLFRSPTSPQRP